MVEPKIVMVDGIGFYIGVEINAEYIAMAEIRLARTGGEQKELF